MLNRIRKMREKKGFTLVELIVVIAIIAILTAVIVPLVGRYAAQATYSTLQDAAKTISNSTATVVADATMMGTVIHDATFIGWKDSGTLNFNDAIPTNGDFDQKLKNALQEAVLNGAVFQIELSGNTVAGVIYATDSSITKDNIGSVVPQAATSGDFSEAYTDANDVPIGVAGNKIP